MAKFEEGKIIDKNVELKMYSSIEHGSLKKVTSIVLHRTDSSNANGTLNAYTNGKKSGAHFLIKKWSYLPNSKSESNLLACWYFATLMPNRERLQS